MPVKGQQINALLEKHETEEAMAEKFLTLMADLDDASQERLPGWYGVLEKAGFVGTQTPGLPYHISMASFPLEQEGEIVETPKVRLCGAGCL